VDVRKIFVNALLSLGVTVVAASASQAMMARPPLPVATNVIPVDYDIYKEPREGGAPLDWCVSYAHECGWAAANRFCRQMGFPRATKWKTYQPGETYLPSGNNHYCRGPQCKALRDVECSY
jgi:hypothetical protein